MRERELLRLIRQLKKRLDMGHPMDGDRHFWVLRDEMWAVLAAAEEGVAARHREGVDDA